MKATASATSNAIDKTLHSHNVDVIISPADSRLPDVVALASKPPLPCTRLSTKLLLTTCTGYPSVTLPLGYLDWNGRPFGLLVVGGKYQEGLLLDVARLWEATFPARKTPDLEGAGKASGVVV